MKDKCIAIIQKQIIYENYHLMTKVISWNGFFES